MSDRPLALGQGRRAPRHRGSGADPPSHFSLADNRVILTRAGSDFDRKSPLSNMTAYEAFSTSMGGFDVAVLNLYLAGQHVVKDIVKNWDHWKHGVAPQVDSPFYGDDLGTLRNGTAYA